MLIRVITTAKLHVKINMEIIYLGSLTHLSAAE